MRWEFDPIGLARMLAAWRDERGWSTRDLSRRAGISQAYVVALERSRRPGRRSGPTPTVDVVARLADAFGAEPTALFAAALRPLGRHALLLVNDADRSPLAHVAAACTGQVEAWILASASSGAPADGLPPHGRIRLHRDGAAAYDPAAITEALRREVNRLTPDLEGHSVGLVFSETSAVMRTVKDPEPMIAFERTWADVVSQTIASIGAHAAWNVCVYEADALARLRDPLDATLDLLRHHDTVWATAGQELVTGRAASLMALEPWRPAGISPSAWRHASGELLASLAA